MKNRITEILGTDYPLILGAMRRITLGEMAAAVSNSGGFGQVGASGLSGDRLRAEIKIAGELTDRPFGINIPIYRRNAFEALEIAIEMGIKTITTSAGNPAKVIERTKGTGLKVLHKVSTMKMALKSQDAGVDGVIATGYEAGGHVGREGISTLCLVPQLVEALEIPVVASGGVGDARGLVAALALGAEGVEVGTLFLATRECPTPDFFKQAIVDARDNATILLGKGAMPMRVLRNKKAEAISDPDKEREDAKLNADVDNSYVRPDSEADSAIMPAGQVASIIRGIRGISEIFPDMINEAKALSSRLNSFFKEVD
jgi:enoyl-[acyl-carrier protein] reductase II